MVRASPILPKYPANRFGRKTTFIDRIEDFRSIEKHKECQAWAAKKMGQRQNREWPIVVDTERIQ